MEDLLYARHERKTINSMFVTSLNLLLTLHEHVSMGILYIVGVRGQPQVLVLTFHLDFEIAFLGFVVSHCVNQASNAQSF